MATTEGIGGFLSVSAAAPATYDATGYAALTWTEIGELGEVPDHGPAHATVTFTRLKDGIVNKYHGELNFGSLAIPMAYDPADAGQAILKAARVSKDEISLRLTRSDGSVEYTSGKVMSFTNAVSVGAVVGATSQVELTRETVDA
ncbi:MAG: hypothetical protein CML61_10060 [Rhodobacteraceae bacterium]|nr:hypothetical protein [Paracoccaceae bacterium]|tara:strand:+ start:85 stop:519 length:435 start_codon:yes stop_codon:yes gene_type:complete